MQFLANESFPGPSISLLRDSNGNIKSIAEDRPGISDEQVMKIAIEEQRTIVTHDSDYGELIYKHGYKPPAGVIYFRIYDFEPLEPGKVLLELIKQNYSFSNSLTLINENSIRQRS